MKIDNDHTKFISDLMQASAHKLGRITSEVDTLVCCTFAIRIGNWYSSRI